MRDGGGVVDGGDREANRLQGAQRRLAARTRAMDEHFKTAPLDKNLPVLLGLVDIWYRNYHGFTSRSVAPYHSALKRYPAYLQQLESSVNGLAGTLKATPAEVPGRVAAVLEQVRALEKEVEALKSKLASSQGDELLAQAVDAACDQRRAGYVEQVRDLVSEVTEANAPLMQARLKALTSRADRLDTRPGKGRWARR